MTPATSTGAVRLRDLAVFLVSAAAAVTVVVIYVGHEDPAYIWDWGGFWIIFQRLGSESAISIRSLLYLALRSIAYDDYNVSGVLPLMPVYWLFGGDRAPYVAAIAALYVVPSAFVAAWMASENNEPVRQRYLILIAALLCPIFWNAALRGMIDVIGLMPLGAACLILWHTRFLTRSNARTAALLGLLLWLTFLFRRWYAFSLVALISLSVLAAVAVVISERQHMPAAAWLSLVRRTLARWTLAGGVSVTALLAFQWPLVRRIMTTSYSDVYAAYQITPWARVLVYWNEFGAFSLGLVALGLCIDLARRRAHTAFFAAGAVLTAVLFSRVQAPGVQHFLPIALMLFPAYAAGIAFAYERLPAALRLAVPLTLTLNFASNLVPADLGPAQALRDIFQVSRHPPLHLENYEEYRRLVGDLAALPRGTRIAVFAASAELSASLLTVLDDRLRPRIDEVSEVDLRDRFRWRGLAADYVVIGRPTPLHLDPDHQRVVAFPAEEIGKGVGIGTSYQPVGGTYRLAGGVEGAVYRRTRPLPAVELARLAERFHHFYPDWVEADRRDVRLMLAGATIARGEVWGQVVAIDDRRIAVHPGKASPTRISYEADGPFRPVRLKAEIATSALKTCSNADSVTVEITTAAGSASQIVVLGHPVTLDLPGTTGVVTLAVAPRADPNCDDVVLTFGF